MAGGGGGGQAKVSARGSRGGFLRDLNALRLDASANLSSLTATQEASVQGFTLSGLGLTSNVKGSQHLLLMGFLRGFRWTCPLNDHTAFRTMLTS